MSLAAEQADAAVDHEDPAKALPAQEEQEIVAVGTVSHVIKRAFHHFYPEANHSSSGTHGHTEPVCDPTPTVGVESEVESSSSIATSTEESSTVPTPRPPPNSYVVLGDSRKQLVQETRALKQSTYSGLLAFLDQKYSEAHAKDEAIAADLAQQGLIIKSQIPMGPSNLKLASTDLQRFGTAGASLLHASELVDAYHRTRLDRNGNGPQWQARQAQALHREPPGYLNPTSTYATRKDTTLAAYQPFIDAVKEGDKAHTQSHQSTHVHNDADADTVMPAHEKRKNLAILARMQNKLDFLRNPRYTEPPDADADADASPSTPFIAEPSPVQFAEYDIGGVYEQTVYLRNASALSRRVRVLPPATLYFSIDHVSFPDASGLVAPGMSVAVALRFAPDSRADYKDELVVHCEGGVQFRLPLLARRTPPELTIPLLLRAQPTLLGAHSITRFPCKNTGGKARFWLMSEPDWHGIETSVTFRDGELPSLPGNTLNLGAFTVSPTGFELDTNQSTTLELAFRPMGVGEQRDKLVVVCDNGLVRDFQLAGRGCQVEVHVNEVNEQTVDASRPHIGAVNQLVFPGELLVNATAEQRISVHNDAPVDLHFAWRIEGGPSSCPFAIKPATGVLPASDATPFSVSFSPQVDGRFAQWRLVLDVVGVPPCSLPGPHQAALLSSALQSHSDALGTVETLGIALRGAARLGSFTLIPSSIQLRTQELQCSATYEATTAVTNSCGARVAVHWDLTRARLALYADADPSQYFRLDSDWSDTVIEPHATRRATFRFTPLATGPFTVSVPCTIAISGSRRPVERWLMIEGHVGLPRLRVRANEVDFGLVLVGANANSTLTIANDSSVADANWSLSYLEATHAAAPATEEATPTLHRVNSKDSVRSRHSDRSSTGSLSLFSTRDLPPRASLHFDPPAGILAPGASLQVAVACHAGALPERFRGTLVLTSHASHPTFPGSSSSSSPSQCVSARAEIQSPNVYLSPLRMSLGTTYLGVAVERTVELVNVSNLDADFRFSEPQGPSKACTIACRPSKGTLQSKQTLAVTLTYTARQAGKTTTLLACAVKGLPSLLGLEVVATHKGLVLTYDVLPSDAPVPVHSASENDAPEVTTMTSPPKLLFGDAIPLTQRKSLQLLIRNWSGIEADVEIEPKRFTVADVVLLSASIRSTASLSSSSPSSLSTRDARTRLTSTTSSSSKKKKGTGKKATLRLTDEHESKHRFQSDAGKEYLRTQQQADEDRELLRDGRGLAFVVSLPSSSDSLIPTRRLRIPPWGSAVVGVTCLNNLPGIYSDTLACRAAGLPPVALPILATVVGSPLSLDTNCVGLRMPGKASSARPPTLSFGHTCVRAAAMTKTLRVVNRGPQSARVKWRIVGNGKENQVVQVSLRVDFAARIQLSITPIDHDSADHDGDAFPFEIVPPQAIVPPFGAAAFNVTFFPPPESAVARALLVADALWLPTADTTDSTASLLTLDSVGDANASSGAPPTTDSRCESVVVLSSPKTQTTRLGTAAGKALQAVRIANSLARSSSTSNNSPTGSITNAAASSTPTCLRVLLAAAAVDPELTLDHSTRSAPAHIKFSTWSPLLSAPTHAFHKKEVELTNRLQTRVTFRLEATGPFVVAKAESLAPRHPLAPADLPPAHRRADGESFLFILPPQMSVRLELRVDTNRLAAIVSANHAAIDKLTLTVPGELLVRFTNQSVQRIQLAANVRRPMVLVSPSVHCFGRVHLSRTRRVVLRLANPTVVPAIFTVRHIPRPTPISKAQKQEMATHHARFVDDPSVFAFSVTSGVVHGPTLSLRSAGGAPQPAPNSSKDLLDASPPLVLAPMQVTVTFQPLVLGKRYKCRFRLAVEHGVDFDLVLEGEGHLDEKEYADQDRSMVRASELSHRSVIYKRLPSLAGR